MAIPLTREDEDLAGVFGGLTEACYFCHTKTKMWHLRTNNPVCESCAKTNKVADLPDQGKAIRARAAKLKRKANAA